MTPSSVVNRVKYVKWLIEFELLLTRPDLPWTGDGETEKKRKKFLINQISILKGTL